MADDPRFGAAPEPDERLDEDEPIRVQPDWLPEIASPLRPFGGAEPPAPDWFKAAIAHAPERSLIQVAGANIELLAWGEVGRPGLLLVHGNSAHADWWSFIAPLLAEGHRVAAVSLSGMGGSDWREVYDFPTFAEELHAGALAAGLYEAATKPVFVGHSFGGSQVFYSAAMHPERMRGAVIVDSALGGPPTPELAEEMARQMAALPGAPPVRPVMRTRPNRVYATFEEALARFRFSPPQVPRSIYAADFIARRSLRPAPMADGSGMGWTWKFDPFLWRKVDRIEMGALDLARAAPMVEVVADGSALTMRRMAGIAPRLTRPGTPLIVIPDSEHHIMVDQPLALVAALRALLSVWPA